MTPLLCLFIKGLAGAYIAKRKKLNPFFWFFVSSIWGLIPILSFICLPFFFKKKKQTPPSPPKPATPLFSAESIWFYLNENDEQQGPLSFFKLEEMKLSNLINEETYVWNETFENWKQWKNVF